MITRFAPSPTGPLHLGHAYSALVAHDLARAKNGKFLLRIEDIDQSRARASWEHAIYDDLSWLGLTWDGPVLRQSERLPVYSAALEELGKLGLIYPCKCTRADIHAALNAPQEGAPLLGPDGVVYPGTCRSRPLSEMLPGDALRLNVERAVQYTNNLGLLSFLENGPIHEGQHRLDPEYMVQGIGDIVLARRDMGTSYHLSVVLDDAAQNVTLVTRGADLFEATPIHRILQALLDLPVPDYHHHRLVRDETGKRLAKRDDARAIATYRAEGRSPSEVKSLAFAGGKPALSD